MHNESVLSTVHLTFLAANTMLGIITMNDVNITIAVVGGMATILANVDKVAYSIVRVLELKRNGWKIPKQDSDKK